MQEEEEEGEEEKESGLSWENYTKPFTLLVLTHTWPVHDCAIERTTFYSRLLIRKDKI